MGDTRFECAGDDTLTAQMTRLSHVIFFLSTPSSLVNTSMRMRTIYKREPRGPYGVENCHAGVAGVRLIQFTMLLCVSSFLRGSKNGFILWQMQQEE